VKLLFSVLSAPERRVKKEKKINEKLKNENTALANNVCDVV
jgi:hypothetical protein